MRILIADDDELSLHMLAHHLRGWGHEVVRHDNGRDALATLAAADGPAVAVLDWMMPGLSGPEVCRRVRELPDGRLRYLILLSARERTQDVVEGLGAGADDYLTKPFAAAELKARVDVGGRVLALQRELAARVTELETALAEVRTLSGMLPMCARCRRIRDDDGLYQSVEEYLSQQAGVQVSHGLCETCVAEMETEIETQFKGA